ncbi:uncharacterized protein BDZ83DRAFT_91504 [Colletotrichum acutatum]|uniref:Uncharacterized protein n=1 Tax=Glomerella acutata TaxID=27357 RepID=A0AAD8UDH1_GLOAC|nr:uncharacterized protein BDZ83DRAFT_91504 [Colletotrichum acutatum]KAK1712940.1 hypothetical protein BDZ83DRAFT_91504 [Colletotrichum acutatum]
MPAFGSNSRHGGMNLNARLTALISKRTYLVLLVPLALMSYLLFLLYRIRRKTLDITGRSSDRQSWSLGHVVALATWIPVVVEFMYMCIFGMKSGLEGRLPAGYEAIPVITGLDDSAEHVPLRTVRT